MAGGQRHDAPLQAGGLRGGRSPPRVQPCRAPSGCPCGSGGRSCRAEPDQRVVLARPTTRSFIGISALSVILMCSGQTSVQHFTCSTKAFPYIAAGCGVPTTDRSSPCASPWTSPATPSCAASRPSGASAANSWASACRSSPRGWAPGRASTWTSSGLGMADGCELRVHPTGKAVVRLRVQTQGQGHETTFAQIVSQELGIPPEDIDVVHGDTDQTPFGLGTYGSRSTPVSGAAAAVVARKVRDKARHHRRRHAGVARRTTWSGRRAAGTSRATPSRAGRSRRSRIARPRHRSSCPRGWRATSTPRCVYNPPNLTYPFGAYICVVDVDPGTGVGQGAPLRRGRRLRAADQPDDRRGPGPRRARRRHRDGADGDDRVRRGRQLPRRLVHGLPAADVDGVPALGAGRDGHAVAAPPDRAPRASASRPRSAHRPPSSTPWWTRCRRRPSRRHAADPGAVWRAMQGSPLRTDLAVE